MNKKPWIIVAVFVLLLACMGQLKISQYPNTKTAAETDLLILATPGVTNWNITVSDFRSNVIAYGGGDTYYISQSYVTNLYVTTNISYFQFVTNLVSISNSFYVTYATNLYVTQEYVTNLYVTTNFVFIDYVTNLYTEIANVKNLYVSTNYTTNLYVTTNYVTYNYVTNQTVYQTNIVNQTITTNLTVYETNINNVSITTNLYVTQNSYISNLFTTNLYTSNLYATNLYVSNIYVTNITIQNGLWMTNRTVTIATNATSATLDFLGEKDWYEVPTLMETNIVLSPTNLMAGREIWVFFSAANGNYDVTITNTAATAIRWNLNSATNGSTSFTVTNGAGAELAIVCRSNNILHAVYGQYR